MQKITGSIFFEEIINSEHYVQLILHQSRGTTSCRMMPWLQPKIASHFHNAWTVAFRFK
jgi:hypothetical protein